MAPHIDSIGKKLLCVLLKLVSLPGIVHRSLALLISVLVLSESVAATPKQFSPLLKGGRGGSPSLAQQSATSEQDAILAAAERAYQEGVQLFKQGTAESLRQAITKFEEALPLYRTVGDKPGEAVTLNNIGYIYNALGEKQKALEYYNQSLPLSRAIGDKAGEAVTLNNIGRVYDDLGEKQKALEYYNQSLPMFRAIGDKAREAVTLNNIGLVYDALGEKQKALSFYNQSLPLSQATGDKAGEARTLNNIGLVYTTLGEKQKALEFYNQSLPLSRAIGYKSQEAVTLNNIGGVYSDLGEKQKALDFYNQSLPLSRAIGDKAVEASILSSIGLVYDALGQKQKALDFYNQSLPLRREIGDKAGEATTLNNIGLVYDALGQKQKALDYYNQSLPLRREIGDKAGEATTLNNIGGVYSALGEKQKALDYYNQSLPLSRATWDKAGEATTLNNIGGVYSALGEKQKALEFYNQSLPLKRDTGDKAGEARILNNIGLVYDALGEKQKALDYYNQSLPLSRATGDKAGEAVTLHNIGLVYDALGEKQKALDFFTQSLPLKRDTGDKAGEAVTLWSLAYLEGNQGNLNEAFTHMKAAIEIIEKLRTNVASKELRASYFATVQGYYQFYIDLLMQLHKTNPSKGYDALALNASERARARSLLEILFEANADIRQGADPKLREQERTLQQQLNALEYRKYQLLNGQRGKKETEELNAIPKEIESRLTQLDEVQAEIRQKSPRYAAISQPGAFTLTLPEIQQKVLDDNTLLLEYSLGEERSYVWAVTKTGITSYELPKRADIEAVVEEFKTLLQSENGDAIGSQAARKLSQMLLAPVAEQLNNQRLVIVGDGGLQTIPFAALPIPEMTSPPTPLLQGEGSNSPPSLAGKGAGGLGFTPLLVNHEIVTLPSASALGVLRDELQGRTPAPKTLAVIADPVFNCCEDPRFQDSKAVGANLEDTLTGNQTPSQQNPSSSATEVTRSARDIGIILDRLPYSRQEAQAILALVPENQHLQALDFAASRTTVTSPNLAQYQIVHLATHGLVNTKQPELSGIVLSLFNPNREEQDGFLRLHDIYNLNLPAELVVLSACETGLGKDVRGEGLESLTRGFMYAGAKRVVVSLWSVNDTATASLMTKFYQQMLEKGLNPVTALRAAQLEMMKTEQWKDPYYWAAFTIQGEWR